MDFYWNYLDGMVQCGCYMKEEFCKEQLHGKES